MHPIQMRRLVEDTRRAEQPHSAVLQAIARGVLERFYGHQALDLVMNREGFSELPPDGVVAASPAKLSRKGRDVLRAQQRVRSLAGGAGIVAQQAFLADLQRAHPKIFGELNRYYEPFQVITQWGFHQPVPDEVRKNPEHFNIGLGRSEARIQYLTLQNKADPLDIRIIPGDVWASIQHAPTILLWVNEAAEVLAILSLKKSQTGLVRLNQEEQGKVVEQLHSLQLKNLRYQYGPHFLKAITPFFQQIARRVSARRSVSREAVFRECWDRFLSLPVREQDRLIENLLRGRRGEKTEYLQELMQRLEME